MKAAPRIIYEDENILVIDKPSGLLTHPVNRKDKSESVVGWLLEKYPEIAEVQDDYGAEVGEWVDLRPGIVHRLDRETSGLLIIAKNQTAFNYLKKSFKNRTIQKTYIALVYGQVKEKSGLINVPLGKLPRQVGGVKQSAQTKGRHQLVEKPSITEYKVLQNFKDFTLLELKPKTGRTHQIRVHLKSIGHPIVCDPLYAGKKQVCPPNLGRLFLHAQKLSFISPSGEALYVETDLPPELESFLKSLPKIKN